MHQKVYSSSSRLFFAAKNVKFIGAVNPQRFPTLTHVVREGVKMRGMWKGLWNERRKELIVHSYKGWQTVHCMV